MKEKKYFQMEITVGIQAESQEEADKLALMLIDAVADPLYETTTTRAEVFETFSTQPYPYP